ncbi:MAG TPA: dihydrolipoamide acetyltransferase family protein [Thermomicrobiales bacterium]|nr:dihydrolipoamide acetyltransferase family protein [Thermomicrobiales bacterium]
MAKTVVMPQMGYDMDAGTLLRWLKNVGDPVERGDAIAEIETDKVNIEIEAFDAGVLRKTLITEGQSVPVGEAIAIIGTADEPIEGDDAAADAAPAEEATPVAAAQTSDAGAAAVNAESPVAAAQQGASQQGAVSPPLQQQEQMETQTSAPVPAQAGTNGAQPQVVDREPGERIRASPLVRRIAAEHEIDLALVNGTGPHGRIVKRDVEPFMTGAQPKPTAAPQPEPEAAPAAAPAPQAAPEMAPLGAPTAGGELRELPRIRQTIGKRLGQSWQDAPHFFVTMQIDMTAALALREQINGELGNDKTSEITVNDLIIKGCALTLRDFPVINSAWEDGKMRVHDTIDINSAVAIEGGLISPFVPAADKKSIGEISRMMKDLSKRAREGGLKPEEFQGGTFTISNLGMFGVDEFTGVINPPQATILAVGAAKAEPVWNAESETFEPKQIMKVTMSADHRLTDGAEVARFLKALKQTLESPMALLVG